MPAAIAFQREHDWDTVRASCHDLAREARRRLADLTGLSPIAPDTDDGWPWFAQMIATPLPPCDALELERRLYREYRIEVPITVWEGKHLVRISFQGYNTVEDLDALMDALARLLPETGRKAS